jgi:outer membrane receptor protein involved in Fe transport
LSLFAYYNVFGRRIEEVGRLGLPDVYQEPFHSVDLVLSWEPTEHLTFKLTAKNVLDQRVVLDQGGFEVRGYRPGPTVAARLGWSY